MRQKSCIETSLKIAAILVALLCVFKCTAQTQIRIQTAIGLVVASESATPDEICISFGVLSGQVRAKHLQYAGDSFTRRLAALARMAEDGEHTYAAFLKQSEIKGSIFAKAYYAKARSINRQLREILPDRAFVEFVYFTGYFQ